MSNSSHIADKPHQSPVQAWRGAQIERKYGTLSARESALRALPRESDSLVSIDGHLSTCLPEDVAGPVLRISVTELDGYLELTAVKDIDGSLSESRGSSRLADDVRERTPEEATARAEEGRVRSKRRAKKKLLFAMIGLGAKRLITLTTRGGIKSREEAWKLWTQFERLMSWRYRLAGFHFVMVPELHLGGGENNLTWHIHFAVNRFFDVVVMRLMWHRVLTGRDDLMACLRGLESPGNVDVGKERRVRILARYLAKYVSKGFGVEASVKKGGRRFSTSKTGIELPRRFRAAMPLSAGAEAYHLRCLLEAAGYRVEHVMQEMTMAGRTVFWMSANRGRAVADDLLPAVFATAANPGYS